MNASYNHLFTDTSISSHSNDLGQYELERRELGDLVLTTGSIVANDPFVFFETTPFTRSVHPGKYPVTIYIAHFKHRNREPDERIAYACVQFRPETPVIWEMGQVAPPNRPAPKPNDSYCYGVDAGTGCFMDAAAVQWIERFGQGDTAEWERRFIDPLTEGMDATSKNTRSWATLELDPESGLNLIAFSSGWGDGCYPTYWGLDAQGEAICLLTDFRVIAPG